MVHGRIKYYSDFNSRLRILAKSWSWWIRKSEGLIKNLFLFFQENYKIFNQEHQFTPWTRNFEINGFLIQCQIYIKIFVSFLSVESPEKFAKIERKVLFYSSVTEWVIRQQQLVEFLLRYDNVLSIKKNKLYSRF